MRWFIRRDGLWEDGILGGMVYGRLYIRRYGLWEMVHGEIWIMGDGTL